MARKFDPATFWTGIRSAEMLRLSRAYGLRVGEVNYLRKRIIDQPCSTEFDPRVIAFLDRLHEDVQTYFQRKCSNDQRFEGIVMDDERQMEHDELWATIRREHMLLSDIDPSQLFPTEARIETMH